MELRMENLTKEFEETTAVRDVTFTMHQGVYGLLGVNGAGKTTLMRMLCTLLKPDAGRITCDGKDIFAMDKKYRNILGYLPQDFGFYPDFSVRDYLLYIASIKGLHPAIAKKRVQELLHLTALSKAQHKKMKKLSGGMKRRAGIAQALLNDPRVLILDEPTAGLDPNERIRFRNLISELSEERLVLLSTHIVSDVEYIADEILLMKDGQIAHSGTQEEILRGVPVQIWTCMVSRQEADGYQKKYLTGNIKAVSGGVEIRVLSSERPCSNAREEEVTLEDVFLYYFGKRGGKSDDAI